jgi:hypothetical protein
MPERSEHPDREPVQTRLTPDIGHFPVVPPDATLLENM